MRSGTNQKRNEKNGRYVETLAPSLDEGKFYNYTEKGANQGFSTIPCSLFAFFLNRRLFSGCAHNSELEWVCCVTFG